MPSPRATNFASILLITTVLGCALPQGMREALMDPGKEQRERKEEIQRLVENRHVESRLQAASAMLDAGRYSECLRVLDEVDKLDPTCQEGKLLRAEVLMAENKFDQAAEIYSRLLEKSPSEANLHHLHAMALELSGDSVGAMLAFQRAAELSPDSSLIQLSQIRKDDTGTETR